MPLNLKEFEPIQDSRMVDRYLQSLVNLKEDIECLLKEPELRFAAYATKYEAEKYLLHLTINSATASAEKIREKFNQSVERNIVLSYLAQGTPFLINSSLELAQPQSLIVKALPPLFKLQRRQALRIKLNPEIPCTVYLPLPWEDKPITPYDISTNGFSLLVSSQVANFFELGNILKAFSIQFRDHKVSIQARVSHKVHLPKDLLDRWKIGFNFMGLETRLEREIARSAYEFNQRIWARRL